LVQNSDFSTSLFPFFYACRKSTAPNGQESQRREQQLTEIPNRALAAAKMREDKSVFFFFFFFPTLRRTLQASQGGEITTRIYYFTTPPSPFR
jgi:hypothetical protein